MEHASNFCIELALKTEPFVETRGEPALRAGHSNIAQVDCKYCNNTEGNLKLCVIIYGVVFAGVLDCVTKAPLQPNHKVSRTKR